MLHFCSRTPERSAEVAGVLAAEEAVRMARDLTQGRMRFNHFTSGGVRRDEIEVSTLRRISKAIAKMLRVKMDSSRTRSASRRQQRQPAAWRRSRARTCSLR